MTRDWARWRVCQGSRGPLSCWAVPAEIWYTKRRVLLSACPPLRRVIPIYSQSPHAKPQAPPPPPVLRCPRRPASGLQVVNASVCVGEWRYCFGMPCEPLLIRRNVFILREKHRAVRLRVGVGVVVGMHQLNAYGIRFALFCQSCSLSTDWPEASGANRCGLGGRRVGRG